MQVMTLRPNGLEMYDRNLLSTNEVKSKFSLFVVKNHLKIIFISIENALNLENFHNSASFHL